MRGGPRTVFEPDQDCVLDQGVGERAICTLHFVAGAQCTHVLSAHYIALHTKTHRTFRKTRTKDALHNCLHYSPSQNRNASVCRDRMPRDAAGTPWDALAKRRGGVGQGVKAAVEVYEGQSVDLNTSDRASHYHAPISAAVGTLFGHWRAPTAGISPICHGIPHTTRILRPLPPHCNRYERCLNSKWCALHSIHGVH